MGGGPSENWFLDNIKRKIGNGQGTKFWAHRWVGLKPLNLVFPRLFQLNANKDVLIGDSGKWVNGSWVWDLKWRWELFDRETVAANKLLSVISNFAPNAGCEDGWTWIASPDGHYLMKLAYSVIKASKNETTMLIINKETFAKIWDTPAPQKARVAAWRILRNKLPTCDNLRKRNVSLEEEEIRCNACIQNETINHVFMLCPKTEVVWDEIQKWLGICSVWPQCVETHFIMFANLGRGEKIGKFLKTLWICTNWILWKWRNENRFEGKAWDIKNTVMEVKATM